MSRVQHISIDSGTATVFACTAVTLFLKGVGLSYLQVRTRFRTQRFSRPEDAAFAGVAPKTEPEIVTRTSEAWRNELENTPAFLSLAAAYVLIGSPPDALLYLCIVFVVARIFQAYAQIRALQPHRMIGYIFGLAASVVLSGCIVWQMWSIK